MENWWNKIKDQRKNYGYNIINEQGDYGLYTPVNEADNKNILNGYRKTETNKINPNDIRLGDCSHLTNK